MEIPMESNLPNLDDMDELINSLWDEKPKRDFSEDQIARITQWLLDGAPSIVPEESAKVFTKKDDNTIPKTIQDLAQSSVTDSDAMQKDKIAFSSEILTPEASPPMWYAYLSDNPIDDPVPSCMLSPKSQPTVMACFTHNQPPSSYQIQHTKDPKAYEMYDIDVSIKQIEEDIERNWPGVVQNVEVEPLHELQPVQQACLKPAPSQVMYEQPKEAIVTQIPACMSAPAERAPHNQLMITPNKKKLGNQLVQDSLTIAVPQTSSSCYEPISPYDAVELAPFKNSAKYFSSLHFAFEDSDTSDPSSVYSMPSSNCGESWTFNIVDQAATHSSDPAAPVVQAIDPSTSYAEVLNEYVHPTAGNSIIYPVQFDTPQSVATEKSISRKSPNSNGTLTEQDLLEHLQSHDRSMKRYKCKSSENSYRTLEDRDRHFDTHLGTPLHECAVESCPRTFVRHDDMLAHMITHDNRWKRERERAKLRVEKENNRKQRGPETREE